MVAAETRLVFIMHLYECDVIIKSLYLGRIVILTLHPPTYEIFTMLSRIVLLSAGRTMYSGKRRNMIPYFSMVDYPCPSFKNPSDYYCK